MSFAQDLSACALGVLTRMQVDRADTVRLTAAGLLVRAHQGMQAALLLAERGLVPEARILVRSNVETAISLLALAHSDDFLDDLIGAHHKHKLTIANVVLNRPTIATECTPEQLQKVRESRDKLANLPENERKSINWEAVASRCCPDIYHTMYRIFSADGSHVSIDTLNDRFEFDEFHVSKIKVGPDSNKMIDTINAICGSFMHSLAGVSQLFPDDGELSAALVSFTDRFSRLPNEELNWSTQPSPPRGGEGGPEDRMRGRVSG